MTKSNTYKCVWCGKEMQVVNGQHINKFKCRHTKMGRDKSSQYKQR